MNHNFFWKIMSPAGGAGPSESGPLFEQISRQFSSLQHFKETFNQVSSVAQLTFPAEVNPFYCVCGIHSMLHQGSEVDGLGCTVTIMARWCSPPPRTRTRWEWPLVTCTILFSGWMFGRFLASSSSSFRSPSTKILFFNLCSVLCHFRVAFDCPCVACILSEVPQPACLLYN